MLVAPHPRRASIGERPEQLLKTATAKTWAVTA